MFFVYYISDNAVSQNILLSPNPAASGGGLFNFTIMEEWKYIEGYEGRYEISNKGRVRSWVIGGKDGGRKRRVPLILSQWDVRGYKYVRITKNGRSNPLRVHRLVGKAFIPNPEGKPEINHKNGVKDDNRFNNLEWVTRSENMRHSHKRGLRDEANENNNGTKLSNGDVINIREIYNNSILSQREIAEKYSINQSQVSRIVNRETWTTV